MSDLGFNKIMAAALSTGLAILGLNAASDAFFSNEAPEEPGYLVEVAAISSDGHGGEPAWVPPTDYGVLLAEADVAKGEKKVAACVSCHKFEAGGANGTGPGLYDVVMRPKATHGGFNYSSGLTDLGGNWDYAALDGFLNNPKKYASGTAMNFAGLNKEADRMNVIAYLRTLSASPAPLPAPLPPEALVEPTGDAEHAEAHDVADDAHEVAVDAEHTVDGAVDDAAHATEGATEQAVETAEEATASVVDDFKANVGGVELTGAANGVEAKLLAFIESAAEPCKEAACWYSFDRLTFNTGSAELDMDKSAAQLDNIAQILNANPNIALKIGGYTDNTGPEDVNTAISQARAEAVVAALVADGISADRLDPEGYGPQHPVASNDTEEGRAQNRRIDVRVNAR